MEDSMRLLKKGKTELSHDPAISFLGTYQTQLKAGPQGVCVYTAALVTITKRRKQTRGLKKMSVYT